MSARVTTPISMKSNIQLSQFTFCMALVCSLVLMILFGCMSTNYDEMILHPFTWATWWVVNVVLLFLAIVWGQDGKTTGGTQA